MRGKFSPWFRNTIQQETDEVMESEDGSVEFETPTDDEEVTIPSQDMARPRQTGREHPPVIDNPTLKDAAGNPDVQNPCRTFLL